MKTGLVLLLEFKVLKCLAMRSVAVNMFDPPKIDYTSFPDPCLVLP